VVVEYEGPGGARGALRPALLLGCDGVDSSVRSALQEWAREDPGLRAAAGSFEPRRVPCPSAGLRFKVLQLPPRPALRDGGALENAGFALLQGRPSAALGRGATPIRMGLLPFKDADARRTANLITHDGEGAAGGLRRPQAGPHRGARGGDGANGRRAAGEWQARPQSRRRRPG
jgi:2-polyprenyl-6-methoxyphenol hydroxylase-like FAD-dependent oxidoreductase